MQDEMIQRIIVCQQENGWIGKSLHGGLNTQEGGTKCFAEIAFKKARYKLTFLHDGTIGRNNAITG